MRERQRPAGTGPLKCGAVSHAEGRRGARPSALRWRTRLGRGRDRRGLRWILSERNTRLAPRGFRTLTLVATVILRAIVVYREPTRHIFGTVALGPHDWAAIIVEAIGLIMLIYVTKRAFDRWRKRERKVIA